MEKHPLLFAPEAFWSSSPEVRDIVCNGCGPGGWKLDLVPDSLWFLDISMCCDIHDWMYSVGATIQDKEEADRTMLNNCLRLIDAAGGWWPLPTLRRSRALRYYEAVHAFGGPAFWAGKNPPATLAPVTVEMVMPAVLQPTVEELA